ncbi:UDP-forming cellulose synthase catalytic subunit [Palleronia abyssalis]|uniref:Cellulose synthase catalytic subunit [UDP-forming] n=1 Tax=Palleronia abyssalis TaxID=1501240 RepID=A0A2R8BTT8_9RHOB|nr:UDP-forming cellulose synthase catalytic subunit [Palleronia abyssalis]SPJ23571.1 Cellulose synthase catalytic subunit [UDP-forming] [Palleronia abyssalis]
MSSIAYSSRRKAPMEQVLWMVLWILTGAVVIVLAAMPISTWAQALLGVTGVLICVALRPMSDKAPMRFVLLAVAVTMVLRYWIWRATETLPGWDSPISMTFAVMLLATETYTIFVLLLTCFMTADPVTRPAPPTVSTRELPTVDVLVPSYNEPSAMLAVTLSAAKNMHYPKDKLRVVLCDDGGTDQRINHEDQSIAKAAVERRAELQKLCADLGVIYSTRERNENAKAGNMSAALARLDGELVAVFDADHVPSRDFLARTAGYFVHDAKLFLVQTPHFFLNPDPINRNIGLVPHCPPENEMFYGHVHRGLDRWDGTFFCGSAALMRRAALDSVGGFSGETITEDAETALDIHAAGWKSIYVNRAMIAGLQPESFVSFIQQRGRWASGMIQMLLLKNPLLRSGLGMTQRLCYINSMAFWFFPVVRLSFLMAPLLYLFFGLEIFVATYSEVIAYMVTYVLVNFIVQNALFNRSRWPLMSELYETAQAPYLAGAVMKTLVKPRGAKFNVTAKDETLDEDLISPIAGPLLAVFGLLAVGVAVAGMRYVMFPGDREVLQIVGGWAVFNLILVGASLQCIHEKQQRRGTPRVRMTEPADVALAGNPERLMRGRIVDASNSGVCVTLPMGQDIRPGQVVLGAPIAFRPLLEDAPTLAHPIKGTVRWSRRDGAEILIGIEIARDQPWIIAETVGHLIYGRSTRWAKVRESYFQEMGLIGGLVYVCKLSGQGVVRTARALAAEPARRRGKTNVPGPAPIVLPEDSRVAETAFGDYNDPVAAKIRAARAERARRASDTGGVPGDPTFVLPPSMSRTGTE